MLSRADTILDAFASRRLIGLLSDDDPALDEDGACAVAHDVHPLTDARRAHEMLEQSASVGKLVLVP